MIPSNQRQFAEKRCLRHVNIANIVKVTRSSELKMGEEHTNYKVQE
jgi:heterodisulfide reductase subunit C